MREQVPSNVESPSSPEERERFKRAVCGFFEHKLIELETRAARQSPSGYVQRFYELCTGSARPWTQEKEFDLLGLAAPLRIRFDQHADYAPELHRMSINIEPLLHARNAHELKEATLSILEMVHHEAEHIFLPGGLEEPGGVDSANAKEWVAYASKASEINAYARQFAFRYNVEYPRQPFRIDNMQALAERMKSKKDAVAYNYFVVFAQPAIQGKYRDVANLAEVHRAIVEQTERHLELLKHPV